MVFFRQGFFYIHSEDRISQRCTDDFIAQILNILLQEDAYVSCGLSQCHLTLEEFRISLQESLYAASAEKDAGAAFTRYNQLGTYQLLFPFAASREMQLYARNILEPIKDYDIENNARLLPTLQQFIQTGCLLEETARRLSQHKNTVRYRLDKIHELTGLDYKIFAHLEQLSMAVKIDQCGGQTY
ncbi:PucR family transcriptional regulator [Ihubacter sp. rT4E-8]|uniref:PucR family transcriptional regulator n=1 Tax=Ihubacter sp. rT4E-8 TaxID=3242369 RepID=UPI003CF9A75C